MFTKVVKTKTRYNETTASALMLEAELAKDKKWASEVALRKFNVAKTNLGQKVHEKMKTLLRAKSDDLMKDLKAKAAKDKQADKEISRELQELVGLEEYISQLQAACDRLNGQHRDKGSP